MRLELAMMGALGALLAPGEEPNWRAGIAEVKITPPLGTRMAGFSARKGAAQSVHDDLFVRALVINRGNTAVALVTSDLIGVDKDSVEEIRRAAARDTGILPDAILVAATHTHSGPVVSGEYKAFFVRSASAAIAQAWRSRAPALIGSGKAQHKGWVGMNRRRLESGFSPVDKEIAILKICDAAGRVRGVLYNYSCHPACLGPDSLAISADWPYFVAQSIKKSLGADVPVLFFQGTEGNVNTGYSAGLSAIGVPIATRTFAYAEEVAEVLAGAILSKLPEIAAKPDGALESRRQAVPLEYYIPSTVEEAEAHVAQSRRRVEDLEKSGAPLVRVQAARVEEAYAGYSRGRTERNLREKERRYAAEMQAFRIGDAGLVSFPGEFFVEIGMGVKRRSPAAVTFCLGLANEGIGYIPIAEAYPEGGYEVSVTRFGPSAAKAWEDEAARLLSALLPK